MSVNMENATTAERVKFYAETAENLKELADFEVTIGEEISEIAKKINVGSMLKVANIFRSNAEEGTAVASRINHALGEAVEIIHNHSIKYNTGEAMDVIKASLNQIQDAKVSVYTPAVLSVSTDAKEEVTQPNVRAMEEVLDRYAKRARSILMQISSSAGRLKSINAENIRAIGQTIEAHTNSAIKVQVAVNEQIGMFCRDYNQHLSMLEDISSSIGSIDSELNANCDITLM